MLTSFISPVPPFSIEGTSPRKSGNSLSMKCWARLSGISLKGPNMSASTLCLLGCPPSIFREGSRQLPLSANIAWEFIRGIGQSHTFSNIAFKWPTRDKTDSKSFWTRKFMTASLFTPLKNFSKCLGTSPPTSILLTTNCLSNAYSITCSRPSIAVSTWAYTRLTEGFNSFNCLIFGGSVAVGLRFEVFLGPFYCFCCLSLGFNHSAYQFPQNAFGSV